MLAVTFNCSRTWTQLYSGSPGVHKFGCSQLMQLRTRTVQLNAQALEQIRANMTNS